MEPYSWTGAELSDREWRRRLAPPECSALLESAREIASIPKTLVDITVGLGCGPLKRLRNKLSHQLYRGMGFVVLTGVPVDDEPPEVVESIFWIIGRLLGVPVSQSRNGDFIGVVEDKGIDIRDPRFRGYESNVPLPFHTDRCDLVALLCLKQAEKGGESLVASSLRVRDELAEKWPDLLDVLKMPFPQDLRGEHGPGEQPWAEMPIISEEDGIFVARYLRSFIEASQRFPDAPRLTSAMVAALDAVDEILGREDTPLRFTMEKGDLQILNNHLVMHSRTEFADGTASVNRRKLLRLWISPYGSCRLPHSFARLFGSVEPGAIRGGVPSRDPVKQSKSIDSP